MISPRITFVYFALLFGTAHANYTAFTNNTNTTDSVNSVNYTTRSDTLPSSPLVIQTTVPTKPQQSVCKQATLDPIQGQGQCMLFLPTGDTLQLVLVALTVGCLTLLMTTLICSYQVCHLRGILSSLQLRHNSIDLCAIREKSESPNMNKGQVDGEPTETCIMLSEVTTAQEESREDEERVLENITEENKDTEQPSTMKDPNGDITQENSHEPDAKAPESSDTGV